MTATPDNPPRFASEFLAATGHELRTPLNAILGMLELSLAEPLSATLRDYLTTARDAARALTVSVDELLDLALADTGKLTFQLAPIQLSDVIAAATRQLEPRARDRQRKIVLRMSSHLPADLHGDAKRLQQIVFHLIEHALDRVDGPELIVEVAEQSRDSETVRLQLGISEFGVGTSQDRRGFVPFEPTSVSKFSAPGFGLTFADCWLRILHGRLWTASAHEPHDKLYATFELTRSPIRDIRVSSDPVSEGFASGSPDFNADSASRPLSVLVADDTLANQKVVKAILTRRGHQVELADNGRQAVERVMQHSFDVILMDAQMPKMNGLQAAEAIRHLPNDAQAQVPIIAMTAHAMQEDRQRCLAAGMDDYLAKPLDVAALIAHVEYYGGRPSSISTASSTEPASAAPNPPQRFVAGALARLGGDEDLLLELIRLFRQDADLLLGKLSAGLKAGDAESVSRAAHNLRGLAANFDATATVDAALKIERCVARGELSAAQEIVSQLKVELDRLLTSLARYERDAAG